MTHLGELRDLQKNMAYRGAKVTYTVDEQGHIDGAFIVGAKGLREHLRDPLSAAEAMRQWLYEHYVNQQHPERTVLGQRFSNGRWRAQP